MLFEQAVSVAPLTLPAHSSIFTGKFPPEHGVRDNGGFFLGPEQVTLAEVLKARGYRTGAFVAAYVLDSKWGIDQGFDTYVDDFDLSQSRGVSLGGDPAAGQRGRGQGAAVDRGVQETRRSSRGFTSTTRTRPTGRPSRSRRATRGIPTTARSRSPTAQLGTPRRSCSRTGVYDRTVIVVMGDHGESLGDHGESAHGFFVYDSVTHVPFVIRAPFSLTRAPARRRSGALGGRDADGARPARRSARRPGCPASAWSPLMTGASRELGLDAYSEAMYPLHHYGWSDLRALRSGRYKVIDAPRPSSTTSIAIRTRRRTCSPSVRRSAIA